MQIATIFTESILVRINGDCLSRQLHCSNTVQTAVHFICQWRFNVKMMNSYTLLCFTCDHAHLCPSKGAECANAVTCFEIVHPNHNNDTCCANRFRDETDAQPMPWLKFSNSVALQAGPAFLPSDNKDISIEHVAYLTSAPMIHA